MSFTFRPARRETIGLIIGLVGPSGGGKTMTALRLATGIAGGERIAVVDTEAGRAKHYADSFSFDHGDLSAPFSPERYAEAIEAADQAKYPVIVVDSFSHEHAGEGGLLDMQEAEFQRMGARESVKMASWIRPKTSHKRMVQRLLQVRAHLILCFRAEQRIEMVKGSDGKIQVVPKTTLSGFSEWIPVAEKSLLYEFTASFLLTPDAPGRPKPIKLQEQMKPYVPLDEPVSEESGRRLAEWAKGGETHRLLGGVGADSVTGGGASGSENTPTADRGLLKAQITGAAEKRGIPPEVRSALGKKLLAGGTIATADLSAVQELLAAVRAWTPEP